MTDSSTKWGLIAFANDGGLGAQTRRLHDLLQPIKVLVIDSTPFSKNKEQHFDWYPEEKTTITKGFPRNCDILPFLDGLTHIFTVENPYNFYLIHAARERGIKVICQTNYEFCENLSAPWLPVPDLFLMPSYWKVEDMEKRFGNNRVLRLPPPLDPEEFKEVRKVNLARSGKVRFLHIVGTLAWQDRNGTLDLLQAIKVSKGDYDITIKSQQPLPTEYEVEDPRITWIVGNVATNADLYRNYDALILPRRYGGLSLTCNEALMSGLPVMMTDISPNNRLLPASWLVPATQQGSFDGRTLVEYYSANHKALADRIDKWSDPQLMKPLYTQKKQAIQIAEDNFSPIQLAPRYRQLPSLV